jgi:hypothetical protein
VVESARISSRMLRMSSRMLAISSRIARVYAPHFLAHALHFRQQALHLAGEEVEVDVIHRIILSDRRQRVGRNSFLDAEGTGQVERSSRPLGRDGFAMTVQSGVSRSRPWLQCWP